MMSREVTPGLGARLLAGDLGALARAATLVENGDPVGRAVVEAIYGRTGGGHVVGVTGPPGAGKSTLIDALIDELRQRGRRVAAILIDPSSPISGGAVLGDRIRMSRWDRDSDVFIRSMAARGHPGGLASTTAGLIHLFDAAGFDPIIVETVGVGQGEIEVAHLAATTLLLQVPGLGDGVQAIKAGILEIGDIVAVNKADLPGAEELVGDLSMMVTGNERPAGWSAPILLTNATTGEGVPAVVDTIEVHRRYLDTSETGRLRRESAARSEVFGLLRQELERESPLHLQKKISRWHELIDDVVERNRTPSAAVATLLGKDGTTCR